MPQRIDIDHPSYEDPIFISVASAFDKAGSPDFHTIGPRQKQTIEDVLSAHEKSEKCASWYYSADDEFGAPKSLEEAAAKLDNLVLGKVTGLAPGFYQERIGTIVRIETEEVIKGAPPWITNYVFFPIVDVTIAGRRICRTNSEYPRLPELGDELVVFFPNHRFNDLSAIIVTFPSAIITLTPDYAYSADRLALDKGARDPESLIYRLRDLVREGSK